MPSAVTDLLRRLDDIVHLYERHLLEIGGIGERHVDVGDAQHRRVEIVEHLLHRDSGDLRGDGASRPAFLDTDEAVGLARLFSTVSRSSGRRVRRSITSPSTPSSATLPRALIESEEHT